MENISIPGYRRSNVRKGSPPTDQAETTNVGAEHGSFSFYPPLRSGLTFIEFFFLTLQALPRKVSGEGLPLTNPAETSSCAGYNAWASPYAPPLRSGLTFVGQGAFLELPLRRRSQDAGFIRGGTP